VAEIPIFEGEWEEIVFSAGLEAGISHWEEEV
jgi:hypothetical protein